MSTIHIPIANPGAWFRHREEALGRAIQRVLSSGSYVLGREVASFETAFSAYAGTSEAVGVANGTDALHLALRAVGVQPGDEVVTVSHTAVATVAAIEQAGAIPVLVDVAPGTYAMDPGQFKDALSPRTRAVVPVHLYGHPAPVAEILDVASQRGIPVVEDCAQAHGAQMDGKRAGTLGAAGSFSFYPTKNLGAPGDGGMVVTGDPDLARRIRELRQYGWKERYVSDVPGVNSRLDELHAAMLLELLPDLDGRNMRRAEIASRYLEALQPLDLELPTVADGSTPVWHQFVIQLDERDRFRAHMEARGIGTGVHYPVPVHLQPAYRDRLRTGSMTETERLTGRIVSLPVYPDLLDTEVDHIIESVHSWFGQGNR